tara:strand:+ start:9675 stop:10700 length:1026 start_codon:yes stop_codon:yes gene_type:complete
MATGRTYAGKEFGAIVGIQDLSASAIGTAPSTSQFVSGTKVQMRVSQVNDIAWDAGYQRAEIERSGLRAFRNTDIINHYGSGVWTWDFDWVVDNEVGLQNLLNLIYPSTATTAASTDGIVVTANPTVDDMKNGNAAGVDSVAGIIITNPETDEDRFMHSAVLQTLTLSMDATSNGGRLNASGQFMSGYKPTIGANTFAADTSAADFAKGLFDCTVHTVGGSDVAVKSFSVTLNNPASRVGYQGAAGEADGYVRGSRFDIQGSISVKADTTTMDFLTSGWQDNTTKALVLEAGTSSQISFNLPAINMSGHNLDMADEGVFVELPFVATSGTGSGNLITIKAT